LYKISFVNPNFQQGPVEYNSFYLPYSVGLLWSYIKKFPHLNQFELDRFVWRRDNIADIAPDLAKCDIVGFSNYIWNANYGYKLARTIKQINPKCLIIFGGPQCELENPNLFIDYPFIDLVIKQEGEISFKRILENYESGDFNNIPGLLINKQGQIINTGPADRILELDEIPSPYLTGVFDHLIEQFPEVEWDATLESNRGCPYACTFCDWGSLTYSKVKKFNLERVLEEIEWIGRNRCGWIMIADANFGMFFERDSIIVDKILEMQKKYGYPTSFTITWAKNQNKDVVELAKKFADSDGKYGLTLSFQTFNETTLNIIKRQNILSNKAKDIFNYFSKNNIPVFTELILGLPDETLETWRENYWTLFRLGNHNNITVYQLFVLENTELNHVQREIYDIKTVNVGDYFLENNINLGDDEIREGIDVVVSTRDMPTKDMIRARIFSWFINTFHINGLTDIVSRFVERYYGIDYKDFYEKFETFLQDDPWYQKQYQTIEDYYERWFAYYDTDRTKVGDVNISGGQNLLYQSIIEIHQKNQYQAVSDLLQKFCKQEFNLAPDLLDDLLTVQRNNIVNYNRIQEYPIRIPTRYNIMGYINLDQDLDKPAVHRFEFPYDPTVSLVTFCEKIWYSRRENYGKTVAKIE
jgi:radical SAM superfamily enzyme YgiQ (UPF0313 family)